MQHPQGGGDQQADRPGPDHHDPVAAALPLQRRVQRDGGRLGRAPPGARGSPPTGCSWVSWATTCSPQPPPRAASNPRSGARQPVTPGSSNRSHDVREALAAGAAGLEAAMHAREHRVDERPARPRRSWPRGRPPRRPRPSRARGSAAARGRTPTARTRTWRGRRPTSLPQIPDSSGRSRTQPSAFGSGGAGSVGHEAAGSHPAPTRRLPRPAGSLLRGRGQQVALGGEVGKDGPHVDLVPPAFYRSPANGRVSRSSQRRVAACVARASFMARM